MDYAVPYQHAAVAPGGTGDSAWAQPLMVPALLRGFMPLVRRALRQGLLWEERSSHGE